MVTALSLGLSVPALATAAFAAEGAPSSGTVPVKSIETSGFDESSAFDAAWGSSTPTLYTGESHDGGTVAFADGGVIFATSDSQKSQAFALVPAHVKLAAVNSEPSLVTDGAPLGFQVRGDGDGDDLYDAASYFTLVKYGTDDWRPSGKTAETLIAAHPDAHTFADWQEALPHASVEDIGASLGSNAPSQSSTLKSLTFAGTTYTFPGPDKAFDTTPAPTISGRAAVGEPLTATDGTWSPAAELTHQWNRDGAAISGATDTTYTPVAADVNHVLTVTTTGTAEGRAATPVTSEPTTPVAAGTLVLTGAPSISGTAKVGQKLTVSPGTWSPAPTSYTYQWLRGSTKVGTNSSSYALTAADNGQKISATVTAHLAGYADLAHTSGSVTVGAGSLTAPTPTVSGTAKVASTLTAHPGTWTVGTKLAYQWKRNDAAIVGATKATYVLGAADRGTKITVTVTGTLTGYTTAAKTSASTATVAYGTFTRATTPTISGTVRVGNSVKASLGTWSPSATFSYQWKQNGHAISGATHAAYTPSASYRGNKLTVTVTATRAGYTAATRTSPAKTIGYGVFVAPTPKITGTRQTGHTLKVSLGTWKPTPSFSYQWKRNGSKIKGATHSSYKTTSADRGKNITVTVTGKKSGYTTRSVTSAAAYVTAPFAHTYAPTITGTTRVYSTLTAHVKAWSPKPAVSYQWKRDGKSIKGATRSTYKLAAADHGHKITVTVTGKKSAYTTTARTSAKTASIAWPKGISTPKITSQPKSLIEVSGKTASYTAKATGGSLRYQWQYSSDGKSWTTYTGKTSATLKFTVRTSMNARYFRVVAKNVAGSATSHSARLFVLSTPLDPYSHYAAVTLWNWSAGFLDRTQYLAYDSTHTLVVSDAMACYGGDGTATPWLDLDFDYIGSNGTRYDNGDVFLDGDIWDAGDVYSGGCTDPFYTVAVVPNYAVTGGLWVMEDSSDWSNDVTQYVRP
jgi:hypothetical protein